MAGRRIAPNLAPWMQCQRSLWNAKTRCGVGSNILAKIKNQDDFRNWSRDKTSHTSHEHFSDTGWFTAKESGLPVVPQTNQRIPKSKEDHRGCCVDTFYDDLSFFTEHIYVIAEFHIYSTYDMYLYIHECDRRFSYYLS